MLYIDDWVWFKGFQKNFLLWIKGVWMLVLSFDSEGFGNVVVEVLLLYIFVVSICCFGGVIEIFIGEFVCGLVDLISLVLVQMM